MNQPDTDKQALLDECKARLDAYAQKSPLLKKWDIASFNVHFNHDGQVEVEAELNEDMGADGGIVCGAVSGYLIAKSESSLGKPAHDVDISSTAAVFSSATDLALTLDVLEGKQKGNPRRGREFKY